MAVSITQFRQTIASQAFAAQPRGWFWCWSGWITPAVKRNGVACAASVAVHLLAIVIAGLIGFSLPIGDELPMVETAWSPDVLDLPWLENQVEQAGEVAFDPGGRTIEDADGSSDAVVPSLRNPQQTKFSPLELTAASWSSGELLSPVGDSQRSHGEGNGRGDGQGDGEGFFGIPFNLGQRIVYVVDNSLSMNHKHDSPAKTRFKRVQMELVNSIWQMEPHQQFYVIFFNRETAAMPDRIMQHATPIAKEHYLTWVAEMKTSGAPTDPRFAMEMALSLQPDIIYFLTDGEFDRKVNRRLLEIKQPRTAIHTFVFGDKSSEDVLAAIAKNNRGKYTYIP